MEKQCREIMDAIQSGDTDQVNDAVERVKNMDAIERNRLFDTGFEELSETYSESDDGYIRQATVRIIERLLLSMTAGMFGTEGKPAGGETTEKVAKRNDTASGFLLEAIQDDDGRVRQSAKKD